MLLIINCVQLYSNVFRNLKSVIWASGLENFGLSRDIQEFCSVRTSKLLTLEPIFHVNLLLRHWCVLHCGLRLIFNCRIATLSLKARRKTVVVAIWFIRVREWLLHFRIKVVQVWLVHVVVRLNLTFYLAWCVWNKVKSFEFDVLHLNQIKWLW